MTFTSDLEQGAPDLIADGAICNFLYSNSKDLSALLDEHAHLEVLASKPGN